MNSSRASAGISASSFATRAEQLWASGELQLACHIIEYAVLAEPDSPDAHDLRAKIYEERAGEQLSSMSRRVFTFASSSSKAAGR